MMKITKEFFRITTKWCDVASFYEHNKKANPIFDIDGCKKRSIHNIRSSRSSIFRFPLKIENPSQKEHNRILYGAGGRDPTIMYLLRALKYQLLSSSKMEESMQQYSHKYEVLHSGQKPFKNEKKTPNSCHSFWKSQKKSHLIFRAKRAKFTFWVDKSSLKMPKMVHFGDSLKT